MALTKTEARQQALSYLRSQEAAAGFELVLLDDYTLERAFGWVFFYDSKCHVETGDFRNAVAGNAPIVVTKTDGQVHVTGTAFPIEHYLQKFESP
jgi:hypothetical protein